jgi:hypothetical protein
MYTAILRIISKAHQLSKKAGAGAMNHRGSEASVSCKDTDRRVEH